LRCPIYATSFTAALLRPKLERAGLLDEVDVRILLPDAQTSIGPFEVQLIPMIHSIPDSNTLEIRTSLGTVVHASDWKLDVSASAGCSTGETKLHELGDDGVLAMICESTNIFENGQSGSESDVRKSLTELICNLEGRIFITCFSSNVTRLETIFAVAEKSKRTVVVSGNAFHHVIAVAQKEGLLPNIKLIADKKAANLRPDRLLYLCTGSQGEPFSALDRISRRQHNSVTLTKDDTVIFSSRAIPGNEPTVLALQDRLAALGADVITNNNRYLTHVTGHPCRDELSTMYQLVRPKIALPVHGDRRHLLEHGRYAKSLQVPHVLVPTNGSMIRLAPGEPQLVANVPAGRLLVDGSLIVPEDDPSYAIRNAIGYAGFVSITLAINSSGQLATDPVTLIEGIPGQIATELESRLQDVARAAAQGQLNKTGGDGLAETVRINSRRAIDRIWGKRPLTRVTVINV
jgi:ribonuclease J